MRPATSKRKPKAMYDHQITKRLSMHLTPAPKKFTERVNSIRRILKLSLGEAGDELQRIFENNNGLFRRIYNSRKVHYYETALLLEYCLEKYSSLMSEVLGKYLLFNPSLKNFFNGFNLDRAKIRSAFNYLYRHDPKTLNKRLSRVLGRKNSTFSYEDAIDAFSNISIDDKFKVLGVSVNKPFVALAFEAVNNGSLELHNHMLLAIARFRAIEEELSGNNRAR